MTTKANGPETNRLSSTELNILMQSAGPELAGECVTRGFDMKASIAHIVAGNDALILALKARRDQLLAECRAKGIVC